MHGLDVVCIINQILSGLAMHNGKMVLSKYVRANIDECYLGIIKTFFVNIDFKLAYDKRPSENFSEALVIGEGYFNASNSFPCIPPKPPLLMTKI